MPGIVDIRRNRHAHRLYALLASVALSACSGLELRTVPPPPVAAPIPDPAEVAAQDSTLAAQLTADLGPLLESADRAIAATLAALEAPAEGAATSSPAAALQPAHLAWPALEGGARFTAQLAPAPPRVGLLNGVLVVEAEVRYAAAMAVPAGNGVEVHGCGCDHREWCGRGAEAPRRARARWSLPIDLEGGLSLASKATFELDVVDRCAVRPGRGKAPVDQTERALQPLVAAGERGKAALGSVFQSFPGFREAVGPLWRGLAASAPLGANDAPWLSLRPRAIRIERLELRGTEASFAARLAINPVVSPARVEGAELAEAGAPAPEAEGFRIVGSLAVELLRLETQLSSTFVGRRYPQPLQAQQRYVEIADVSLYGANGRLVIKLRLEGAGRGDLVFTGRLRASAEAEMLLAEELEMTPDTVEALALLFDEIERPDLSLDRVPWIDGEKLTEELASASRWPIHQPLRALRTRTEEAARYLGIPGQRLWFSVEDAELLDVSIGAQQAQVWVLLQGRAAFEKAAVLLPLPGASAVPVRAVEQPKAPPARP